MEKSKEDLEKEIKELKEQLKEAREIELEAVARYRKVADELLMYYTNFGKENKKK